MTAYNLYLLDLTRDPRVLGRISRITGVQVGVLRREFRSAPFLVLKESTLSRAVTIRRELEKMGLRMRLERVENPTGDSTHPLADEQAPEEGGEIVLEEGRGFKERPASAGTDRDEQPPPSGGADRRWLKPAVGGLIVVLLLAFGWATFRSCMPEKETAFSVLRRDLGLLVPSLIHEARTLLEGEPTLATSRQLELRIDEIEARARPVWNRLPVTTREQIEELRAVGRTLSMRSQELSRRRAEAARPTSPLMAFRSPDPRHDAYWRQLSAELRQVETPGSWLESARLQALVETADSIRIRNEEQARRLDALLPAEGAVALERTRARALAGNLRHKGVRWYRSAHGVETRTDLPNGLELELVAEDGNRHEARVADGRVVFESLPADMNGVALRLAALNRQPPMLRGLLEQCLKLSDPIVWEATLPGQQLPRFRSEEVFQGEEPEVDPALRDELAAIGLDGGFPLKPRLTVSEGTEEELRELVLDAATAYRRYRVWPRALDLHSAQGRFRVTGAELLMLSGWSTL